MDLHPDLAPFSGLVGAWEGDGTGQFPTTEPFVWVERMEVAAPPGRPVLSFRQRTRHLDGTPFHAEDGWVRPVPTGPELVVAQPTGIVEVHTGTLTVGAAMVCDWTSRQVLGTPTSRTVLAVRRRWRLEDDVLHVDLWLHTPSVATLTHHLAARLGRVA